jgi:adenosylhomocysteine nucleosidase
MNAPGQSAGLEGLTLVCFAVEPEARPFRRALGNDVRVRVTGMGPLNAERSVRAALAETRPDGVLTCGFAGGLDPSLRTGDVVFDVEGWPELGRPLEALGAKRVRFHCATRVAVTAAEKRGLRKTTGRDAVEMESGAICAVCGREGIAAATVRVILDEAEEDLPLDFNQLADAEQNLALSKLLEALGRSPGRIPGLIRFGSRSKQAAKRLAMALSQMFATGIPRPARGSG